MNPPASDNELTPEKLEQDKEGGPMFHCGLYDADLVRKIAEEFLPSLASACVDNTTGGLFRSPASVAVDVRREMVESLTRRSENFVSESVVLDGGLGGQVSDEPYEIISDFVDDFASSKRNFFSKVSGWLLSERREDRIDDFVQEMELSGFWLLIRREALAQTLLKNVDFKRVYHCTMSFRTAEELEDHRSSCCFRTMICTNEGCNATFSAAQSENHDSICPFKILQCEQNCGDFIMRRQMDRHCITVCSMKPVKCPFFSMGCTSSIPKRSMDQHHSENLESHVLHILQFLHKDVSAEDLGDRVVELMELASPGELASACDARSLTSAVKRLEGKAGPLKIRAIEDNSDDVKEDIISEESLKEKTEVADAPSEEKENSQPNSGTPDDNLEKSFSKKEKEVETGKLPEVEERQFTEVGEKRTEKSKDLIENQAGDVEVPEVGEKRTEKSKELDENQAGDVAQLLEVGEKRVEKSKDLDGNQAGDVVQVPEVGEKVMDKSKDLDKNQAGGVVQVPEVGEKGMDKSKDLDKNQAGDVVQVPEVGEKGMEKSKDLDEKQASDVVQVTEVGEKRVEKSKDLDEKQASDVVQVPEVGKKGMEQSKDLDENQASTVVEKDSKVSLHVDDKGSSDAPDEAANGEKKLISEEQNKKA